MLDTYINTDTCEDVNTSRLDNIHCKSTSPATLQMTPKITSLLVKYISGTSQALQHYMDITWHITVDDDEQLQMTDGS